MDFSLSSVLNERYWSLYGIQDIDSVGLSLQQYDMDWNEFTGQTPITVAIADISGIDTSDDKLYNQNGVRIVTKDILGPASDYDSYYNILLLAENTGSDTIKVEIPFNVLSINGFMVEYFGKSWELLPGQCALMEIQLFENDLEEINISDAGQITQVEFALEISQGNIPMDAPTITINRE